ncbi:MAG: hypothetical protein M3O50_15355 [Myxococcota bacterium]|nr:hypothetical protein [Myxococcota bacterium]
MLGIPSLASALPGVETAGAAGEAAHAPDVDTMQAPEPKSQQLMLPGAAAGQPAWQDSFVVQDPHAPAVARPLDPLDSLVPHAANKQPARPHAVSVPSMPNHRIAPSLSGRPNTGRPMRIQWRLAGGSFQQSDATQ